MSTERTIAHMSTCLPGRSLMESHGVLAGDIPSFNPTSTYGVRLS